MLKAGMLVGGALMEPPRRRRIIPARGRMLRVLSGPPPAGDGTPQPAPEVVDRIQELMDLYPSLADRFIRHLLTKLHSKGLASIDSIYDEARSMVGEQPIYREAVDDPNSPSAVRWEGNERQAVREVTLRQAAAHLSLAEIEEGLNPLRRRAAAR